MQVVERWGYVRPADGMAIMVSRPTMRLSVLLSIALRFTGPGCCFAWHL